MFKHLQALQYIYFLICYYFYVININLYLVDFTFIQLLHLINKLTENYFHFLILFNIFYVVYKKKNTNINIPLTVLSIVFVGFLVGGSY